MTYCPLVQTDWLAKRLGTPDLVVLDGSTYIPQLGRNAKAEYAAEHIPGAVHFDIDEVSDPSSGLPHTLPAPHVFSSKMRKLGIGDGQTIVVYDGMGIYSAPRVWWMFRVMGVKDVFVLDGGLPKWKSEGHPVDDKPVQRPERHFNARLDHAAVADTDDIKRIIANKTRQILDARAAGRFSGKDPEPRAGLRSGHMPGAFNLPVTELSNPDGTLKDTQTLRALYENAGIDLSKPVTTTCGSGVTAAALTFGLTILGHQNLSLYDGSWSEWASREDTEIVTD